MITVIGSSNTDMVVKAERFCQPGETILGGQFYMFPGGKGGNQAVAAARLGGKVALVAKVGNDIFGKNAVEGYEREGIKSSYIFTDEYSPSGVALITVNRQGENTIVVASGANHSIRREDIDGSVDAITSADIILVQLEIPLAVVEHVFVLANEKNKKVILNPAPAQPLPDNFFKHLFAITPNETEAEILTGIYVHDVASAANASQYLISKGVRNVVITMGSKGAYLQTTEYSGMIEAPVVVAVDTTAAGDVFNGALAVALQQRQSWLQAATFACRAASVSVTRMGAQSSAPYLKELSSVQ